jgi:hypothetical protein
VAVRINRTLLYDVQWTRAADMEATIAPLVSQLYGPGAVVLAHAPTNKLFIYIPSRREREAYGAGAGGAAVRPRGAAGATEPGTGGLETGRGGASRRRASSRR